MNRWIMTLAAVVIGCSSALAGDDSPQLLFQRGLHLETADADYKQAAAIYGEIVEKHGDDRALAAQSLYRQGLCFERLRRTDDAAASFLKLSESYPGEIKAIFGAAGKIDEVKRRQVDKQAVADADRKKPVTMDLHLVDGSYIVGQARQLSVEVATLYGKLDLPLCQIRSIVVNRESETVSASMRDGTIVSGKAGVTSFSVVTEFGEIAVNVKTIDRIELRLSPGVLPADLTKDLVLYYAFDKDAGGQVLDLSDKKNNGKVKGASWIPNGKVGGAYRFSGGSDMIYASDASTVSGDSSYTIATWFKKSGTGPMGIVRIGTESGDGVDRDVLMLSLTVMPQSRLVARVDKCQADGRLTPGFPVQDDVWYHAVLVYSKFRVSLYVNGKAAGSVMNDFTGGIPGNRGVTRIGGNWTYVSECPFTGLIDEVMVFSRALTAEQVDNLYRAGGGRADVRPSDQKIPVPGNGSADAGEVIKGQRYWFEASGLVGINVGGPNGGPAHKADPDGRTIAQADGIVTAPSPADERFPCPGLATHSLIGMIAGAGEIQPGKQKWKHLSASHSRMQSYDQTESDVGRPTPVMTAGPIEARIQLGSKGSFVAPASGRLTLLCNDLIPGDNSGAWEVRISR